MVSKTLKSNFMWPSDICYGKDILLKIKGIFHFQMLHLQFNIIFSLMMNNFVDIDLNTETFQPKDMNKCWDCVIIVYSEIMYSGIQIFRNHAFKYFRYCTPKE